MKERLKQRIAELQQAQSANEKHYSDVLAAIEKQIASVTAALTYLESTPGAEELANELVSKYFMHI